MKQSLPNRVRGWTRVGAVALVLALPSFAQSTKLSSPLALDPGSLGGDVERASFTPDGSRVLYLADQDAVGVRDLYSVPADGSASAVRLSASLTADPSKDVGRYQVGADGARVVFSTNSRGPLHSAPVDGSAPSVLLASSVSDFWITPDASSVVYLTWGAPDELRLVPIDGSGAGLVLDTSDYPLDSLALSADGLRAVYVNAVCAGLDCAQRVRSVLLDGSAAPLTLASTPLMVSGLTLTADSSRALYLTQGSWEPFSLHSVPLDGSAAAVDLDPLGVVGVQEVVLSPDGARVVFTANFDAELPQLFSAPCDGSASAVQLNPTLPASGRIFEFQITPDSSRVVYRASQNLAGVYELFTVPIGGGSSALLSGALVAGGDVNDFQVSPDSIGVVFRADKNTNGTDELFGVPFGGVPFPLSGPLVAGGNVLDYAISADDLHVVYRADRATDEVRELYRVAITGGASRRLSAPPSADADVADEYVLAPDSSRVVYLADALSDEVVELFSAPLPSVAAPVLLNGALEPGPPAGDVVGYRLTADGSAVVYAAPGDTPGLIELYRAPVSGGPVVKLSGPFVEGGSLFSSTSWDLTADGAHVVYLAEQEDASLPELFSAPTDGSAPAQKLNDPVAVSGVFAGVRAFELTPDGQRVVYRVYNNLNLAFLYVARVDGTDVPLLVSLASHSVASPSYHPLHRISPDGTRVVYRSGFDLYSAPLDGSQPATRLTPAFAPGMGLSLGERVLAISPDSRWVVYLADAELDGRLELYSVAIDGQGFGARARRLNAPLAPTCHVYDFEIDADSRRVAYVEEQPQDEGLALFSVPIQGVRNVRASSGAVRVGRIRLSPSPGAGEEFNTTQRFQLGAEGEHALFLQGSSNGGVPLFAAALDGSVPALSVANEVLRFRFTTDGGRALYRTESEHLYRAQLDGLGTPQLLNAPRFVGAIVASTLTAFEDDAASQWVVYTADERIDGMLELFARPLDLSTAPLLLNGPLGANGDVAANGSAPAFRITPGATHVVYLADQDRDAVFELYSSPLPSLP